eukprot:TRINITY_DN813_c0_g1_i4.p1 TRINITY_DN813_c0_g1~~TRINITY_DN813_c0_g1_i4.p1  ORF type:complete len:214 (-),score=63.73 TRINITY_DN813_c0_g1_i4:1413-2018(-)
MASTAFFRTAGVALSRRVACAPRAVAALHTQILPQTTLPAASVHCRYLSQDAKIEERRKAEKMGSPEGDKANRQAANKADVNMRLRTEAERAAAAAGSEDGAFELKRDEHGNPQVASMSEIARNTVNAIKEDSASAAQSARETAASAKEKAAIAAELAIQAKDKTIEGLHVAKEKAVDLKEAAIHGKDVVQVSETRRCVWG